LYSGGKPYKDPIPVKHLKSRSGFQASEVEVLPLSTTIKFARPTSIEIYKEELAW